MTTTLATTDKSKPLGALGVMASRFQVDPTKLLSTLKSTAFKGATDDEMMALCIVSNEYGLNPLLKEIYAFPAKGGGITPVVSIDGWIRIVNEHPQMDGVEFEWKEDEKGDPISCTAVIYRKDRSRPVKVTEYFNECSRGTDPWKMKHRMLRHKALIQCGRVAFGFAGGIYDEDEAADIKPARAVEVERPNFKKVTASAIEDRTAQAVEPEPAPQPETNPVENQQTKPVEAAPVEEKPAVAAVAPTPEPAAPKAAPKRGGLGKAKAAPAPEPGPDDEPLTEHEQTAIRLREATADLEGGPATDAEIIQVLLTFKIPGIAAGLPIDKGVPMDVLKMIFEDDNLEELRATVVGLRQPAAE